MDPTNPNTIDTQLLYTWFNKLDQHNRILAEYVWIGGTGMDLRCKTRSLEKKPKSPKDLPVWNFDGSSTGQAPGDDSEVMLHPVKIYKDPFRGGDNILVLCECKTPDGEPVETNNRHAAEEAFNKKLDSEPWFGIEQEYTMFNSLGRPLGWPLAQGSYPGPQGPYYCSIGAERSFGRIICDEHYRACIHAGVKIAGCNAEVMPGQWEFQVGPCVGISMGDDLFMARYLLERVAELHNVAVSFDPKPIAGDWNGAGCHTNYSTKEMRADGGLAKIKAAIEKMSHKHAEHIAVYGSGNERRLTGQHETASIESFSYGVADRGASVRIPRQTDIDGKGYMEDRRPASNIDPYTVTAKIFNTTVLE